MGVAFGSQTVLRPGGVLHDIQQREDPECHRAVPARDPARLWRARERAVEAAASEAQQAQLLERINQLNILRESNATLRADCESHAKKARALETKLQQLTSELEPTKEQLRVAKAELDAREAQVKRLEDETRRWQERNSQLLTKVWNHKHPLHLI